MESSSYSHPATRQDEWILGVAEHRGHYIEIGAYDGLTHSNTKALEEHGWSGLLIEGNPDTIDSLVHNRGPHQVVEAVVAHKVTQAAFIKGGQYSGLERFMPDDWMVEHHRRKNKAISVKTTTLSDIYHTRFVPKFGPEIDYLSLDTEGNEAEILKSFPHRKNIRWLSVEFRYDTPYLARLSDLLLPTHRLVKLSGFDAFFERLL